jgi:hypothetical protein
MSLLTRELIVSMASDGQLNGEGEDGWGGEVMIASVAGGPDTG